VLSCFLFFVSSAYSFGYTNIIFSNIMTVFSTRCGDSQKSSLSSWCHVISFLFLSGVFRCHGGTTQTFFMFLQDSNGLLFLWVSGKLKKARETEIARPLFFIFWVCSRMNHYSWNNKNKNIEFFFSLSNLVMITSEKAAFLKMPVK